MAKTQYKSGSPSDLTRPAYGESPLRQVEITSRGTESKPVPPKPIRFTKKLNPAPTIAQQPGASGTI